MARKEKKLVRNCSECGNKIKINVDAKGHYDKGHYTKIKLPVKGTGEWKKVGVSKLLGKRIPVVKWTGEEKEYEDWECNPCHDQAMREGWLEEMIEDYYGKRCKDFEASCAACDAWSLYDKIKEQNSLRGNFRQGYDKSSDNSYIYVKDIIRRGEAKKQLELSDYVILDFNKKRELLGIEVLTASKYIPKVFKTN